MKQEPISDVWYVLYEGQSEDGRGFPIYSGRTYSPTQALAHYRNKIAPLGQYAIGRVDKITDTLITSHMKMEELRNDVGAWNEKFTKDKITLKAKPPKPKPVPKAKPIPKPDGYGAFA